MRNRSRRSNHSLKDPVRYKHSTENDCSLLWKVVLGKMRMCIFNIFIFVHVTLLKIVLL